MAKILIVGAGDVGARLATGLAAAGHEVHALRRSLVEYSGVQAVQADVTDPATLTRLPAGLDIVLTILSPGESGAEAYRRVYVGGTRNVLQALSGQTLIRHFWVSSTSVYGEDAGQWIDEQTPARPASETSAELLNAEQVAREAGWPCTVVRFGGLYGPGRHRLLNWVASGREVQQEPPSWTNRLHVDDAAGLLQHLVGMALRGVALAELYLGVDDAPSPQYDVLAWLAQRLHKPVPVGVVRPGASQGKRIANKALGESGYVLRYPDFRAGYDQVLAARELS